MVFPLFTVVLVFFLHYPPDFSTLIIEVTEQVVEPTNKNKQHIQYVPSFCFGEHVEADEVT
jgi:hypothetical protein